MGLLKPEDWQAKWIGVKQSESSEWAKPRYMRTLFAVNHTVRRATLYATALGLYEVRLNGRRTGDAQFFMRAAVYNMDVSAFFNKWLVDVCEDAQLPDSHFADHAPTYGPGDGPNIGWSDAGIICPYEIYRTYGDTRVIMHMQTVNSGGRPVPHEPKMLSPEWDAWFGEALQNFISLAATDTAVTKRHQKPQKSQAGTVNAFVANEFHPSGRHGAHNQPEIPV